jgi:phage-related protein
MINFYFGNGAQDSFDDILSGGHAFVLDRVGFESPKRDVSSVKVPGRHGTLTLDNKRWENVNGTYKCFIQSDYITARDFLNEWLCEHTGFTRLEDTVEPTVYRMARYVETNEVIVKDNDIARIDIKFELMPQRWLKSGETEITIQENPGSIVNQTPNEAYPLIVVEGQGELTIGSSTITVGGEQPTTTLDCDIQRAYNGNTPLDSVVGGTYPVLAPGSNPVSWTGFTSVKITPRWWKL